jgi:hypothetical protein
MFVMILRTMRQKQFDMVMLRRRAKSLLRKKYKKTIDLRQVDAIWKDWVNLEIVPKLLEGNKVAVGSKATIEVVGRKTINSNKVFNLLVNGLNVTSKGMIKPAVKMDLTRPNYVYKIVYKDNNYDGDLIFEADPKLSLLVHEALKNPLNYFRIENVSK